MESMELATSLSDRLCASCGPHLRESKATDIASWLFLEGEITVLDVISKAFRVGLSESTGFRMSLTWLQFLPHSLTTS